MTLVRFPLRASSKVGVVGNEDSTGVSHRRFGSGQITARNANNGCAFLGERRTNRLPDSPARARDNNHFVFESHTNQRKATGFTASRWSNIRDSPAIPKVNL